MGLSYGTWKSKIWEKSLKAASPYESGKLYYREQKDSINPQLLALKKKKNHQTSYPWAHYQSSKQHGRALVNQVSNMGAPLSVSKAKFYHLHTSTGLSPSTSHSLGLPPPLCPNSWSPLPPHTKASRDTHPSTHNGVWWPRCAASGLSVDIWRPPRQSHWSQDQSWLYFSS